MYIPNNILVRYYGLPNHGLKYCDPTSGKMENNMYFSVDNSNADIINRVNSMVLSDDNQWLISIYKLDSDNTNKIFIIVQLIDLLRWNNFDLDIIQTLEITAYNYLLKKLCTVNEQNSINESKKIINLQNLLDRINMKPQIKCIHEMVKDTSTFDPCISFYKCKKCGIDFI